MRTKGHQVGRKSLGGQAVLGRTRKYALGNPKRIVDGRGGQSMGDSRPGQPPPVRKRDTLWDAAGWPGVSGVYPGRVFYGGNELSEFIN